MLEWLPFHLKESIVVKLVGNQAELTIIGTNRDRLRLLNIGSDNRFELQAENNDGYGACVMPHPQSHKLIIDNINSGDTLYITTASGTQVLTV